MPYREFPAEGRASVGLYAIASSCAHRAELVCRGRVVVLVSYGMTTAAVERVVLDYCIIVLHVNPNPTRYQVITYQVLHRPDLNLCLQPLALIILKL